MTMTRTTLMAACCGALLLAGCSSTTASEAETSSDAATTDTPALAATGAPTDGMQAQPAGLTGEIAYVSDGTAQVQDGSSQTAVRFTADTAITQQVQLALADLEVGACVMVTLDEDGAAATVTVTDPEDDGTCATGFGGMGDRQMPDGDMPTDMPSGMPSDMPEGGDAPSTTSDTVIGTVPGDDEGGGFAMASIVAGTVTEVGDAAFTVEDADGETTEVGVADATEITGTEAADADAVVVGMCMTAQGEADSSGGYDATTITVFDAGDEGCVTAGFGGRGGMGGPGGDAPAMGSEDQG